MENNILLVGGSNIDYIATSINPLVEHVSNIGILNVANGGVMRNVTENLLRLGNKCTFLTALGNDANGRDLRNYMEFLGCTLFTPDTKLPTSGYVAINNNDKDMIYGINDMRIIDELNYTFLDRYRNVINKHNYVIMDSNLSRDTISYLLTSFTGKRFLVEGISPAKIIKYKDYLNKIYLLKCNVNDAKALFDKDYSIKDLVLKLLDSGVKKVVISEGKNDIYYGENNTVNIYKIVPVDVKGIGNTTGCGDALFSGIIDKVLMGKTLEEAIDFGVKLSNVTITVNTATTPLISNFSYYHEQNK
ncbi:MAG: carbohydrate kinase family protein [Bacilli bacterium]